MKYSLLLMTFSAATLSLMGCGGKKENADIITRKPTVARVQKTKTMGDYRQSRKVEWLGATYTVETDFRADRSVPQIADGVQKYYDNRVTVRILRADGSEFFNRTFSKTDFSSYLDNEVGKKGALLGVVFDRAEGGYLYFAASVGSPDKSSDEYVPLVVRLSRFGEVSVHKDSTLDTGSDTAPTTEAEEEDGV